MERTYKGCDGYAPILAYLGQEGYCVNVELREGNVHSQNGTPEFLQKTIELARQMTDQPLLVRMDSGCDSADNMKVCFQNEVDFIIKRNPRKETAEDWLAIAQAEGTCREVRPGKKYIRATLFPPLKVRADEADISLGQKRSFCYREEQLHAIFYIALKAILKEKVGAV